MRQKRRKSIAVAVIVLLIAGLAIWNLNIEPADNLTADGSIQTSQAEGKEDGDTVEPGQTDDVLNPEIDGTGGNEDADSNEDKEERDQSKTVTVDVEEETSREEFPATVEQEGTSDPQPSEEKRVLKCTFEIRCDTLTDHSKVENEAILPYIPDSGVILSTTEVEFTEGETVFDALQKVTRQTGIQMEFRNDKLYTGGAYIEGIGYLYEFDGGPLSGWMYKVNGQFPNYGCAGYTLKEGDEVIWVYTCDLGTDVGDNSVW